LATDFLKPIIKIYKKFKGLEMAIEDNISPNIESSEECILLVDKGGVILKASAGASRMFEKTPDQLIGISVDTFQTTSTSGQLEESISDCLEEDPESGKITLEIGDGRIAEYAFESKPLDDGHWLVSFSGNNPGNSAGSNIGSAELPVKGQMKAAQLFHTLYRISKSVAPDYKLEDLCSCMVDESLTAISAADAVIAFFRDNHEMEFHGIAGAGEIDLKALSQLCLAPHEGPLRQLNVHRASVSETGLELPFTDLSDENAELFSRLRKGRTCTAAAGAGIYEDEQLLGAVIAESYRPGAVFDHDDHRLLRLIALIAAGAAKNAALVKKIRKTEDRLRGLFESLPVCVWSMETEGRKLTMLSPAIEKITGRTANELMSGRLNLFDLVHKDDRSDFEAQLKDAVQFGQPRETSLRLMHANGDYRYVTFSYRPVRDEKGAITRLDGVIMDITEQKRIENQVYQTQKMETVGRLASGIAHDFNNLLAGVMGHASLAMARLSSNDETYHDMEVIHNLAEQAAELTRELLAYARGAKYEPKYLELNSLIRETVDIAATNFPEAVRVRLELDPQLAKLEADATQMKQVIMNVTMNAAEAMPNGGNMGIRTQMVNPDPSHVVENPNCVIPGPAPHIMLSISDTGQGMDPQVLNQIFEPFFSTREEGRGMGLAAVHGIVESHKGSIVIRSQKGRGTIVRICMPAASKKAKKVKPVGKEQSILVVDDEPVVRDIASQMLQRLGYTPITAESGEQAVEIYKEKQDEVKLVLLDAKMPGMNGVETFYALQKINPAVRVLMSSGYDRTSAMGELDSSQVEGFLEKPYDLGVLADMVQQCLGSPAST
jgi:PAS domain S-box-containing protein